VGGLDMLFLFVSAIVLDKEVGWWVVDKGCGIKFEFWRGAVSDGEEFGFVENGKIFSTKISLDVYGLYRIVDHNKDRHFGFCYNRRRCMHGILIVGCLLYRKLATKNIGTLFSDSH